MEDMANYRKYVDLMSDSGFKAVYADPANKPLLITLLNLVLPDDVRVNDIVEYRDREQARDTIFSKRTILDLVCKDDKGNIFSVEIQRKTERDFFRRCMFYAAGHYHSGLRESEEYYTLNPVYVVAFMEGKIPHTDELQWDTDNLVAVYRMTEVRTNEVAPPTLIAIFAELGRFTKEAEECVSERDRVFYWMKHSEGLTSGPYSDDSDFEALVRASEIAAFSPEKKAIYDKDIMTELDIRIENRRRYEEGREEGRVEGKAEEKDRTARAMKVEGLPLDIICRITGLTVEQVEAL